MIGELRRQPRMGQIVLRHHEEPARVLVEAVDDAGPAHPADARQAGAAMGDESVHQGARVVTRRRVHHEARRLVDHDEVVVLVGDHEVQAFGHRLRRRRFRHDDAEGGARADLHGWIEADGAVPAHVAGADEILKARARDVGEYPGERPVQAFRRRVRVEDRVAVLRCHRGVFPGEASSVPGTAMSPLKMSIGRRQGHFGTCGAARPSLYDRPSAGKHGSPQRSPTGSLRSAPIV